MNKNDLLDAFRGMTLLELAQFVKDFEATFDVTAAVPLTQMVLTELPPEPEADEPSEFTVVLEAIGDKKIQVIKEVRAITKHGLSESKALVDNLPNSVLENVSRDVAEKARAALAAAGATVSVR